MFPTHSVSCVICMLGTADQWKAKTQRNGLARQESVKINAVDKVGVEFSEHAQTSLIHISESRLTP